MNVAASLPESICIRREAALIPLADLMKVARLTPTHAIQTTLWSDS
jgi:hypothetical protein